MRDPGASTQRRFLNPQSSIGRIHFNIPARPSGREGYDGTRSRIEWQ
jgi:hypothetical protein